jgi:hypothetical protein
MSSARDDPLGTAAEENDLEIPQLAQLPKKLVFANAAGEMIDQSRLTKRLKRVLARAEIEAASSCVPASPPWKHLTAEKPTVSRFRPFATGRGSTPAGET